MHALIHHLFSRITLLTLATAGSACEAGGTGTLSVLVEAEDTITQGLDPGEALEDVRDGWSVRFTRYIVALGDIVVDPATGSSDPVRDEAVFAVDLRTVPSAGLPLWELPGLAVGRWGFAYAVPAASSATLRHESVQPADFDAMTSEGASYLIEGSLTKPGGVSCPPPSRVRAGDRVPSGMNPAGHPCYANETVAFRLLVAEPTRFEFCELEGIPGFAVARGSTTTVTTTLHGDHLFFNGFPEGDEGGIVRLAQWLADCDLDLDGTVTKAELEAIELSELGAIDERYRLGTSPITLASVWDYVRAQLKTQGHMNGEGECQIGDPAGDA